MRTSTYIGDGRRRHVTHLCGCGRLGRSESRGRGSTCTRVEAHMLRCSANLPASFIVAAVCRCHGIFIQVQLRKIFAAVTAEAKKAWPVDALERSFFWVANFAKRLFFFFTLKKSPRPPLPSPSSHLITAASGSIQQAAQEHDIQQKGGCLQRRYIFTHTENECCNKTKPKRK
jgi:hypothetical protein